MRASLRKPMIPATFALLIAGAFWPTGGVLGRAYQQVAWSLHELAMMAVGPVARPFSDLTVAVRGDDQTPIYLDDLDQLNEELARRDVLIRNYYEQLVRLRREVQALQQLAPRLERQGYVPRLANVIARTRSAGGLSITIDRGRRGGIVEGLPVVDLPNLIGRVTAVGPVTATVKLITSPGMELEAAITPPPAPGEQVLRIKARCLLEARDDGTFITTDIEQGVDVAVDDIAYLSDRDWAEITQGMVIGRVVEVEDIHEPVLRQRVVVEPYVDPMRVGEVTVSVPRRFLDGEGEGAGE